MAVYDRYALSLPAWRADSLIDKLDAGHRVGQCPPKPVNRIGHIVGPASCIGQASARAVRRRGKGVAAGWYSVGTQPDRASATEAAAKRGR